MEGGGKREEGPLKAPPAGKEEEEGGKTLWPREKREMRPCTHRTSHSLSQAAISSGRERKWEILLGASFVVLA